MPEYTYLLDTRLSTAQKNALSQVRDAAREAGMTVFLAGGAVRDLTTGSSVRDLDFSVQGNALDLRGALEAQGAAFWGEHQPSRTLFLYFPGSVRVEVASTRRETFPKPGQPVYEWSGMVDDLHRRDFTVNAMALSLNEGSYGLLLDPLNGVADIEARQLRLVSNYGFLEDPARLVRLVRLRHRMGWTVEERTATRYENAKEADNFDAISTFLRGYEIEEIATEDDPLGALKALEAEGWMAKLHPGWTAASADAAGLDELRRSRIQLLMQGISPDLTAAHLQLLTANLGEDGRKKFKSAMVRPGLRAQWESLDDAAKEFARLLTSKDAQTPSAAWKLFNTHAAEPILWLAYGKRTPAVDAKFKNLFTVWPEVAKKVPVALMIEMRITPELPNYAELLHALFLQQIDGKLDTDEAMRAFLEPYSPPAPPPPVTLKRTRGKKADGKGKRKGADLDDEDEDDEDRPAARGEDDEEDEDEEDVGGPPELGLPRGLGGIGLDAVLGRIASDDDVDIDHPSLDEPDEIAPLTKTEPAEEAEPSLPPEPESAEEAGIPPIAPVEEEALPVAKKVDAEPSMPVAKKKASPKKADPEAAPSAPPAPASKKQVPAKKEAPAKKASQPPVKKSAAKEVELPAEHAPTKATPSAAKKVPAAPVKKAAVKSAKPADKH